MFSFHKPKIYRSMQGCCICRAKSSSSRFTDSKRYEHDFPKCFEIMERRSGEICNACVLLVKRWKKLPAGSNRNWHHVVDARAGPGTKSMNKIKNKAKLEEKLLKKKHKHKHKKSKSNGNKQQRSSGGLSDDVADDCLSDRSSSHSGYISNSDDDDENSRSSSTTSKRRKQSNPLQYSSFLDLTYWKKTEICCGIIFKGANGEVMVDMSLLRPCRTCKQPKSDSNPGSSNNSTADQTPSHPMNDEMDDDEIDDELDDLNDEDEDEIMDEMDDMIDEEEDEGLGSAGATPQHEQSRTELTSSLHDDNSQQFVADVSKDSSASSLTASLLPQTNNTLPPAPTTLLSVAATTPNTANMQQQQPLRCIQMEV